MRSIQFRGKCTPESKYSGEWVEGGIVQCDNGRDTLIISAYSDTCSSTYHVLPETIGQFTGLRDKNSKEIYEGDIIRLHDVGVFYIKYNEERCQFELYDFDGFADKLWELYSDRYEVIGNIFDDSKLLKNYDRAGDKKIQA